MSKYDQKIDFITRTQEILMKYEANCEYEKTLFLNCCVGLLIMPQQCADKDKNIEVEGVVDYENWGVNTGLICINKRGRGNGENTIENIAYHIRNSICHYRFNVISGNNKEIEKISITDVCNGDCTFDIEMDFKDFRKFVLKYADELKKKLANS